MDKVSIIMVANTDILMIRPVVDKNLIAYPHKQSLEDTRAWRILTTGELIGLRPMFWSAAD